MVEKGGTSAVFTTALTEAGAEQAVEDEGEEEEDAGEGEEEDVEDKEEGGTEVEVGELAASASSVAGGLHLFFFLDFLAPGGSSTPAPGAAPPPFLFPFFFPPTDCCDERPMSGAGEAGSLSMVDAPLLLVSGHQTPYRAS